VSASSDPAQSYVAAVALSPASVTTLTVAATRAFAASLLWRAAVAAAAASSEAL